MVVRKCIICKKEFNNKNNKKTCSKKCCLIKNKKWQQKYHKYNKEDKKIYKHNYYIKNKKIIQEKRKQYYDKNINKIKLLHKKYKEEHYNEIIEYKRKYREKNKYKIQKWKKDNHIKIIEKNGIWIKNKKQTDKLFNLRCNISSSIAGSIKRYNSEFKKQKLNYSIKELKEHLEKQFDNNMSWETYGKTFEIGHKIPISWFDNEEDFFVIGWDINNLFPIEPYFNRYVQSNKFALINGIKFYDKRSAIEYFKELYK
jgi:hypothetical protein